MFKPPKEWGDIWSNEAKKYKTKEKQFDYARNKAYEQYLHEPEREGAKAGTPRFEMAYDDYATALNRVKRNLHITKKDKTSTGFQIDF